MDITTETTKRGYAVTVDGEYVGQIVSQLIGHNPATRRVAWQSENANGVIVGCYASKGEAVTSLTELSQARYNERIKEGN